MIGEIKQIDYKTAKEFVLSIHYSGRMPSAVKYSFGLFDNEEKLKAVCIFSIPASNWLCQSVCGEEFKPYVIELSRLCRLEDYPCQLSQFVSKCLKMIGDKIVVSYSDTAMSHNGYIYQACNFIYTGVTKPRKDRSSGNGKHSRHYDKDNYYYVLRSAKHRYIYFTGTKKMRKKFSNALTYPRLPYPKGKNKNYEIGFTLGETRVGS